MNIVFFLIPLLLPVVIIGLVLILLKIRTGKIDETVLSRTKWLLCAFAAVLSFFCLFEDKQTIFECRKDTMTCTYYRSTIAAPELRPARSFDIKDVRNIELTTERRRQGERYYKKVYRIVFVTPTAREEFPTVFDIKEWAEEEIGKINRFLKTDRKVYIYSDGTPDINEFERGMIFAAVLTTLAFVFWCFADWKRKRIKNL